MTEIISELSCRVVLGCELLPSIQRMLFMLAIATEY